jgi:L-amino acid N-acyltransferase YncA
MPPVACRAAEPRDADAIAEIHVAAFEATFRGVLGDELLDQRGMDVRRPMWHELLADVRPGHISTVAEREGQVVGFATAVPSWYPDHDPTRVIDLSRIYVCPGLEGTGVGPALYVDQERRWRQAGWQAATTQIGAANERSMRFFARRGWRPDGHERRAEDGSLERRFGKSRLVGRLSPQSMTANAG